MKFHVLLYAALSSRDVTSLFDEVLLFSSGSHLQAISTAASPHRRHATELQIHANVMACYFLITCSPDISV